MLRALSTFAVFVSVALSASVSHAAGQQKVGASTIAFDDQFRWDRKVLDTPPKIIGGEAALAPWLEYPTELRRRRIEGHSIVSVTVTPTGTVTAISFSPRLHSELERLVTTAVKRCHWKPGEKRGRLVTGTVSFPVTFRLTRP